MSLYTRVLLFCRTKSGRRASITSLKSNPFSLTTRYAYIDLALSPPPVICSSLQHLHSAPHKVVPLFKLSSLSFFFGPYYCFFGPAQMAGLNDRGSSVGWRAICISLILFFPLTFADRFQKRVPLSVKTLGIRQGQDSSLLWITKISNWLP